MATRRQAREWVVQILFNLDLNKIPMDELFADFWKELKSSEKSRLFTQDHVRGVMEHIKDIDTELQSCATNWDIKRMGVIERNVMRMAIYEMLYCKDIPPVVSINEAVDIAKYFSSQESGKFVNGILDNIRKKLSRAARGENQNVTPKGPKEE